VLDHRVAVDGRRSSQATYRVEAECLAGSADGVANRHCRFVDDDLDSFGLSDDFDIRRDDGSAGWPRRRAHRLHDLALLGDRKAFFEDNLATLSTSTPISEHVRVGAVTD
jgi:hypothetical protein